MNRTELILAAYEEVTSMQVSILQIRGLILRVGDRRTALKLGDIQRELNVFSEYLCQLYESQVAFGEEIRGEDDGPAEES